MEISPGVHQIPGVIANAYLIVEPDGLTLIDAGLPRKQARILGYINRLGYQPTDLKRIIITHADDDHYGSLKALKAASDAVVFASEVEAKAIRVGRSSREMKLKGVRRLVFGLFTALVRAPAAGVDHYLREGQRLPILGNLQVLATPGHTPGHVSLYAAAQGILFAGDSLRSTEGNLRVSSGANTWDESLAQESAARQARFHPRIVCVGHGPVVYEAAEKFPVGETRRN